MEEYECSLCECKLDKKNVNENFVIHFCKVCDIRIENILREWHCSAISDESMAIFQLRQEDKIKELEKENRLLKEKIKFGNLLS